MHIYICIYSIYQCVYVCILIYIYIHVYKMGSMMGIVVECSGTRAEGTLTALGACCMCIHIAVGLTQQQLLFLWGS